jgi:type II secretion system protein N
MNLRLSNFRLTNLRLKPWQRWTAYAVFGLVAFGLALRQTFPSDAVKERIILEAAAAGWQVNVVDVRPWGFGGIDMSGVTLESRDGVRIPVERLDASVRLFPLLLGRRGIAFDARLFEGRIRGVAEATSSTSRLTASIAGVDLSRAVALRTATGMDLTGTLQGTIDVTVDEKQAAQSSGSVDLAVDGAAVNGGQVPIPGMGGALTVPKMGLGKLTAKASVKEGKLVFDRLETRGDDLEATGEGLYFVLQPRLAFAPIFGKAKLRIRDSFWTKSGAAAFKPIVEVALAQARGPDGSFGFQIFGTLSQPQARMGQ